MKKKDFVVRTIKSGKIAMFITKNGIEIATKSNRYSSSGESIPVAPVSWDDLGDFIKILEDIEEEKICNDLGILMGETNERSS